jgi:hypothetical protein
MAGMPAHTERSTLAACLATVIGVHAADVPLDEHECRAWLGQRGLGLVPVDDAPAFAWPGPWIAWRPARDGGGRRAVVMFGVPSGPIWDPAGTDDTVLAGFVVAPLDVAVWEAPASREPGTGVVEALVVGPAGGTALRDVAEAVAIAGHGLEGDRYAAGAGTFASGRPGSALTLVDAAVLDELRAARGGPIDHRRNVVVRGADLNALVGRRFTLGQATCEGRRLCEPCAHLERLNRGGVLRPLVHRGGLRADIVEGGAVQVGDALQPI